MVLGIAYLTWDPRHSQGEAKPRAFTDTHEVFLAYSQGRVGIHSRIRVRLPQGRRVVHRRDGPEEDASRPFESTVGRIVFNDILPEGMVYYNYELSKGAIGDVIS